MISSWHHFILDKINSICLPYISLSLLWWDLSTGDHFYLSVSNHWNILVNYLLYFECISVIYTGVTLATLAFTELWWPCFGSLGGFLNIALFLSLFVISFTSYLKCVIVGPGFLPLKWKPVWVKIIILSFIIVRALYKN